MKIIKKIFRPITLLIRGIYRFVDKCIVIPITKLILLITDKLGKHAGRFEKWLVKKNTLIFLSLILALALFFYVDNSETLTVDKSAEVLYDQKVDVVYNEEKYVIEGLPDTVDVTIIGRRQDLYLAKQYSNGSITADLTNYKEGTHKINLEYKSPIDSVSYKLDPSSVNITIYPKVSKTMTVTTELINEDKLDTKLSIGDIELDTSDIVLKGAEHTLNEVSKIKALIDVSKLVDPKEGTMTIDDVKLVAYDENGDKVDVETVPSKVSAKVLIESPSKELPIKVVTKGSVVFGSAIDSITTSVTKVKVYGNKDILDSLESIPVEIDIDGLESDKVFNAVLISKPAGVKEISETSTNITVKLAEETTKEIKDVYIEALNLDSKYKVVAIEESSSKTSVIVKGTKTVLDNIDSSMVSASVDLTGYKPGDYEVLVSVTGEDEKATYASKVTKIKVRITEK